MNLSNRGFRARRPGTNSLDANRPEDIGNRRSFDDVKIPPDNIGNRCDTESAMSLVNDSAGNSLDEEPSHLKSGVLSALAASSASQSRGKRGRGSLNNNRVARSGRESYQDQKAKRLKNPPAVEASVELSSEQWMEQLVGDFAKLLRQKAGSPFSFTMKTYDDTLVAHKLEDELKNVGELIRDIFEKNQVNATYTLQQYSTSAHRFAVFFIDPSEKDAVKNKVLIAALRQVVNKYIDEEMSSVVNVFLVLANAQNIIEEHLAKVGAKKNIEAA